MKKRKRGEVDEEGISERKKKVSCFVDEKQNNKPSELVRTVKGLLQKEQTRLAGVVKGKKSFPSSLFLSITRFGRPNAKFKLYTRDQLLADQENRENY